MLQQQPESGEKVEAKMGVYGCVWVVVGVGGDAGNRDQEREGERRVMIGWKKARRNQEKVLRG